MLTLSTKKHKAQTTPSICETKPTLTGCRLDALDGLYCATMPISTLPWQSRLSINALRMSLELSQMAYTMNIEPWCNAGWTDVAMRIDDRLKNDVTLSSHQKARLAKLTHNWKLRRIHNALNNKSMIADVMSAFRQREQSDSLKAVLMMHALPNGHHLLAIGFMGTGGMISDWLSNVRFTLQDGFHKGFDQLCKSFEKDFDDIRFPATAKALGLAQLTLSDVLQSMQTDDSPFHLWMTGHSQGGAVLQVLTHRLLVDQSIPATRILGVGFASPSVAARPLGIDPAHYPLWHVINADDFVPRGGSGWHFGKMLRYRSDDALRKATYFHPTDDLTRSLHEAFAHYDQNMVDSPTCLLHFTAMLFCIADETNEELSRNEMIKGWRFVPGLVKMFAGDKAQELLSSLYQHLETAYCDLTGSPMPLDELEAIQCHMRPLIASVPIKRILSTLACYANASHAMVRSHGTRFGPYAYIVCYELSNLLPSVWTLEENMPKRILAPQGYQWAMPSLPRKRRRPVKPRTGKHLRRYT